MFGTATRPGATRALLLGSGELGKEVAIELQRLGIEVIAADRYAHAPAMQVAHAAQVLDMLDGAALRALVAEVKPDLIIPRLKPSPPIPWQSLSRKGSGSCPTPAPPSSP